MNVHTVVMPTHGDGSLHAKHAVLTLRLDKAALSYTRNENDSSNNYSSCGCDERHGMFMHVETTKTTVVPAMLSRNLPKKTAAHD